MRVQIALPLLLIGVGVLCTDVMAQSARKPSVIDIALTPNGMFVSQCQNSAQSPVSGAQVGLYQNGQLVAQSTSRADGWFQFSNVQTGSYELRSEGWENSIRLWTAAAAPPAAQDPIVLVLKNRPVAPVSPIQQTAISEPAINQQDFGQMPSPPAQSRPQIDDQPFIPLDPALAYDDGTAAPAPQPGEPPMLDPVPPQNGQQTQEWPPPDYQPTPAEPYQTTYAQPQPYCNTGPTVGDVVATAAGIAGITIGGVAIYNYDDDDGPRTRRPVSP